MIIVNKGNEDNDTKLIMIQGGGRINGIGFIIKNK
jgi:hypothetical protein